MGTVVELLPWMKVGAEHSIQIEPLRQRQESFSYLCKGLFAFLKFSLSVGLLILILGVTFSFAKQNEQDVLAFRDQVQQTVTFDQPLWGVPQAAMLTILAIRNRALPGPAGSSFVRQQPPPTIRPPFQHPDFPPVQHGWRRN